MLKQSSSDNSLHVDLQKTLHIVCRDSIAAIQNSELSSGDSTQSIAALLAAVATASSAKAAEVKKLVAASQKVWSRLEPHVWKALWTAAAMASLTGSLCCQADECAIQSHNISTAPLVSLAYHRCVTAASVKLELDFVIVLLEMQCCRLIWQTNI